MTYFNKKQLIIIFGITMASVSSVFAESEPMSCSQAQDCGDCLANGCSWVGICIDSCDMIADVACYSQETFPTNTSSQICEKAELDKQDAELCSGQEGCSACMTTIKSDGTSCKYYLDETGMNEAGGYCGTGECGMMGCPLETCPRENPSDDVTFNVGNDDDNSNNNADDSLYDGDDEEDEENPNDAIWPFPTNNAPNAPMQRASNRSCNQRSSCSSCLARGSPCAWTGGSCRDFCDLADAACYTAQHGSKICPAVEAENKNGARCGRENNCQDCTTRSMLDAKGRPSGFCSWYSTGRNSGYCGTSGCDMWGNCGNSKVKTCPRKLGLFRGSN